MTNSPSKGFIDLTAEIVSAYVGNNTTPAAELPALIGQVHAALVRVSEGQMPATASAAKTRRSGEEVADRGIHRLPRGRKEVQVAQAAFADAVQHDAGAIP